MLSNAFNPLIAIKVDMWRMYVSNKSSYRWGDVMETYQSLIDFGPVSYRYRD